MAEFMLLTNTNRVIMTISKFFYDKYNFKVFENIKEPELSNMTRAIFIKVNDECKADGIVSIEDMNMRAMSALKEAIRSKVQGSTSQQQPPQPLQQHQHQSSTESSQSIPIQSHAAVHLTAIMGDMQQNKLETALEEDEFFSRMRLLEDNRKAFEMPPAAPPPAQLTHPVPIGSVLNTDNTHSVAQPQQSMKPSTVVTMHGWDRQVAFSPQRNSLVWAGPLSPSVSQVSVVALLLPNHVTSITPYVVLEVVGVGGQTESVHLIPKTNTSTNVYGSGPDNGWVAYESIKDGFMTPLACPWNIKLFDAFKAPLSLGEDVATIIGGVPGSANRVLVNNPGDINFKNVVLINNKMINVSGMYKGSSTSPQHSSVIELSVDVKADDLIGTPIVNVHKQFVVIMVLR